MYILIIFFVVGTIKLEATFQSSILKSKIIG